MVMLLKHGLITKFATAKCEPTRVHNGSHFQMCKILIFFNLEGTRTLTVLTKMTLCTQIVLCKVIDLYSCAFVHKAIL